MLSLMVFVFSINELIEQSETSQYKGIYINENHPSVFM